MNICLRDNGFARLILSLQNYPQSLYSNPRVISGIYYVKMTSEAKIKSYEILVLSLGPK